MPPIRQLSPRTLFAAAMFVVGSALFFLNRPELTEWGLSFAPISEEKFFADESALIAQTYYFGLASNGEIHHPDWLHPAAYDHGPIYKYVMGFALRTAGYELPNSLEHWERWHSGRFDPPENTGALRVARIAMLCGAVFGCLMAFWLGWQLAGNATGILAATFLALSPLYYTHARRAMADDLAQAFVLATLVGAASMARSLSLPTVPVGRFLIAMILTGVAAGLGAATKLNASVGILAVGLLSTINLIVALIKARENSVFVRRSVWFLIGSIVAGLLSVAVFIGIDPYFYSKPDFRAIENNQPVSQQNRVQRAHPSLWAFMKETGEMGIIGRAKQMLDHRTGGLTEAAEKTFPEDALRNPWQRFLAVFGEGSGRWSSFGIGLTDPKQSQYHWILAIPFLILGLRFSFQDGHRQFRHGQIPFAWLLLIWPTVESVMLMKNLTLNWDRYYMGVVAWTSLLTALAITGFLRRFWDRLILRPDSSMDEGG